MLRKWTNTYRKVIRPRHRTREQMKKHASRPSAKSFSQEIPEKTPCRRQMQTNALRPAGKWSGQGIQQRKTVWETKFLHPGKAGIQPSKHLETNEKHWKMILPRHQQENHCVETNEEKWRHTHIGKWSGQKGAIISETNIWQTHKRNESSHIENDPATKTQETIIWETNERKLKETFVTRPPASHRAIRMPSNPSQAKLFLIKTWGSIGARFKPWSSLDLFRQPRSWILPQSSAWDFSPGERASDQMTTICFTRKNHFDKKRWNLKVRKKKNRTATKNLKN